ncbi:MAG: hypothetical protein QGG64_01295 [Candidatus Latescibacteria bacterium]|jgi:hypothetical protein|nr:hypothetical protein [Candidatus Latescibacterota bacterium]
MPDTFDLEIEQITFGSKHHFFGYIGQSRTIPWNESGRYIVALRTDFQDHMPGLGEYADVILIDRENNNSIEVVDRSLGWNPQQGTMFYWNPESFSPDGKWIVNGSGPKKGTVYVMYRLDDGVWVRTERFDQQGWVSGELRCDPAPCWNRASDQVVFPSISGDGTRQMFVITRKE